MWSAPRPYLISAIFGRFNLHPTTALSSPVTWTARAISHTRSSQQIQVKQQRRSTLPQSYWRTYYGIYEPSTYSPHSRSTAASVILLNRHNIASVASACVWQEELLGLRKHYLATFSQQQEEGGWILVLSASTSQISMPRP